MKITKPFLLLLFCIIGLGLYTNPAFGKGKNIILKLTYKVSVKGHLSSLRLKMVLPASIPNRQTLNDIEYSIQPDSVYTKFGNTYALFKFYDVDDDFKIAIKEDITIYQAVPLTNQSTDTTLSQFLIPEQNIESSDAEIQKLAAELKQPTDIETVMKTYFYVKDNITYKKKAAIGALGVLETGVGKCMDFSDLFVALLRANNIPAKSLFGLTVWENEIGYHAWPEVYLKKQGWIQFDPTTGHTDIWMEGKNYKMSIKNKYVVLLQGRNEPELRLKQYHWWSRGQSGTEVKIKQTYDQLQ
jgi:transglutaminase-like putative cysteine protease